MMTDEMIIEHCLGYTSDKTCDYCEPGFLIVESKCVKIEKPIEHCDHQVNNIECEECGFNFIPSLDGKTCLTDPEIANCLGYAPYECRVCSDGFLKNPNMYFEHIFHFEDKEAQYI